jgi:hypothetical protein
MRWIFEIERCGPDSVAALHLKITMEDERKVTAMFRAGYGLNKTR